MILVENIWKSFGQLVVLKGIELKINKKEMVSISGESGAGKTTLLQIIGTLMKPDNGKVIINNTSCHELGEKSLARFRNESIGFVFQFHHLLPEFTALENTSIPGFIRGDKKQEAEKKACELLVRLGLENRLDHKPAELSGGEKQRVAIARALINNPAVILADEPSGNLDSKNSIELYKIFQELRQDFDQTFIIVTHNEQHAELADRKLTIKDGMLI
ncbi:MAG: ABC transporter ATP-binding protein [Bacteroidales bacterium]|jgi:lipoprotein-releasing system ATP-binding protein